MAAYKLSEKYWVIHFMVIFRFVTEQLLVTVALDHPVSVGTGNSGMKCLKDKMSTKGILSKNTCKEDQ